MKKNKKIFISLYVTINVAASLLAPIQASAFSFSIPGSAGGSVDINVGDIIREGAPIIEDRYGFDQDEWKRAKRKVNAPRVEIFFDNTNPKPGEKVTANAVPEFFKNDPPNLYFTWYLIHTENGTPQTSTNSISEGKEEAAGIMARGDYDPALDDQKYEGGSDDPDKDGWPSVDANNYDKCSHDGKEGDEADCSFAPMGGSDGVGGLNEELREKFSTAGESCRGKGDPDIARCSMLDATVDRPLPRYSTLASNQSNFYCNRCLSCFDQASPTTCINTDANVEDLPQVADLDERNQCCYDATPTSELPCTDPDTLETIKCPYNSSTDYCGSTERDIFSNCYNSFRDDNRATISACINKEFEDCKTDWEEDHQSRNEEVRVRVSRCYKHKFGVNFSPPGFGSDDSSGIDEPVSCDHKWPHADDFTSGSGKFSTNEEDFWSTDPRDPDTDGDGTADEADVIGLGQDTFTWTYQAGDRVGVAVEGTSMIPTDEKNAYYKIMWGYLDVCDATKKDLMNNDQCESGGDEGFGYLATKSPSEEVSEEKIKAALSFTPESPIADPETDETISGADQIDLFSSLDNTTADPSSLYYTWFVQKEDRSSKTGWSGKLDIGENFSAPVNSTGIGISSFSLTPKKELFSGASGDILKIKVTMAVSRTASANEIEKNTLDRNTPRKGYASVEIPINTNGIRLSLHKVDIQNGKAVVGEEVCNEGLYKLLCPAVKGQMLAAKISGGKYNAANSEFSWSLNQGAFSQLPGYNDLFTGWNSTTVFFPITKEVQGLENISITAIPKDKLQPVSGSRLVTVVEPAVFIKSSNESTSWPMKYAVKSSISPNTSETLTSDNDFEALASTDISYYLDFVPYYLLNNDTLYSKIDWSFNGIKMSEGNAYENAPQINNISTENENRTLKFSTGSSEGEYYALGAEISKYWSEDEGRITFSSWGIAPEAIHSETSATIETVLNTPVPDDVWGTSSIPKPAQILAAVGSHLPHYIMYNLRLALTLLVMFFISAGFYAVSQSLVAKKEE